MTQMNFQRPENALKRAEELREVGKDEEALFTLHAALSHRKLRSLWTTATEKIAIQLIEQAVELKNMKIARDGLIQYRTMTQSVNIASLETVVNLFRTTAEKKVTDAKRSAKNLGLEHIEDLEAFDAPIKVMLNSLETPEARARERSEKVILQAYRFLWEAYKAILDILRTNSRMEALYHETAQIAMEFCRVNKRVVEFKRLCEMLRNNWLGLFKGKPPIPQHQTSPHNPETIQKTLETRCVQLKVATELELWRESFASCEDIHTLMVKSRKPKPQLLAQYYEFLSQICWVSESYLFHAFSCLRTFILYHNLRKSWTDQERHELASRVILATIVVPFDQKSYDGGYNEQLAEKNKRMATLFNVPVTPTRQTVCAELRVNVLHFALPAARGLYDLLEGDTIPLNLCDSAQPLLSSLEQSDNKYLQAYVEPLKRVIFFRLLAQLSKVYSSMTLDHFQKAISTVPLELAEKWIASSSKAYGVRVQIDYVKKAIVFGDGSKAGDFSSIQQPITQIGNCLRNEFSRINTTEKHKDADKERDELLKDYESRMIDEKNFIRTRREEIDKRKDAREQIELQKEQEEREKRLKQEQEEQETERLRKAEEKTKREIERLATKKKEFELAKNKAMLEDLSKTANLKKFMVAGKRLDQIAPADLDAEQIEMAREKQLQKKRADKVRTRKMEAKRVDHLARALGEEEVKRLPAYREELEVEDIAYFKSKHEETIALADCFRNFSPYLDDWESSIVKKWQEEMRDLREKKIKESIGKAKAEKIKRAMLARQEDKFEKDRSERDDHKEKYDPPSKRSDQQWR